MPTRNTGSGCDANIENGIDVHSIIRTFDDLVQVNAIGRVNSCVFNKVKPIYYMQFSTDMIGNSMVELHNGDDLEKVGV